MKNYKKGFIDLVAVAFIGIALLVASGVAFYKESSLSKKTEPSFGSFSPTAGGTYRLQSSVGTSNTSITLSSFKEPTSGIKYTMSYLNSSIMYGTLDPQTTYKELISFTGITQNADGTATLTGVSRGLGFSYPYTASSTLAQSHSGQSIFILSNAPQLYNQYSAKANDETITGLWTFAQTPLGINPGGQPNATESILGVSQLATQVQMASSTALGSSGGSVVLQAKYATSSPYTTGLYVPVTRNDGKLNPNFIATTSSDVYNFGGNVNVAGQSTIASSTIYSLNVGSVNATSSITLNGNSFPLSATSTTYLATTTTHTWTKPTNAKKVFVQLWGAGGGGGRGNNFSAGGGGGGEYIEYWFDESSVSSTVTITIGSGGAGGATGGAGGATGGATSFGSYLTANGGLGGDGQGGSDATGGSGGNKMGTVNGVYGAGVTSNPGQSGMYSAGGGGSYSNGGIGYQGGNSYFGGAGGGGIGSDNVSKSGGTSTFGGAGGSSSVAGGANGIQPSGGGGAGSGSIGGKGGAGKAIVTVFY